MIIRIIEIIAIIIPTQFLIEICSLNKNNPDNVEAATMATLLIVNIDELSKPSTLRAFSKKYMEQ